MSFERKYPTVRIALAGREDHPLIILDRGISNWFDVRKAIEDGRRYTIELGEPMTVAEHSALPAHPGWTD